MFCITNSKKGMLGMKKLVGLCFSALLVSTAVSVEAHPGRTDSNGGHTCRKDCEKWGLQYGEYHYHNGGGSSGGGGGSVAQPVAAPQPTAEEIRQQELTAGQNAGYTAGAAYGATSLTVKEGKTTEGSKAYQEGYVAGYKKGMEEAQQQLKQKIEQAKTAGEKAGKALQTEQVPEQFSQIDEVKKAYQESYKPAYKAAEQEKITEHKAQGKEHGLVLAEAAKVDDRFKAAYEEGYKEGKQQKEKQLHKQGYDKGFELAPADKLDQKFMAAYTAGYEEGKQAIEDKVKAEGEALAFTAIDYEPAYKEEPFATWHQQGFDNNTEREAIITRAYESGVAGEKYELPTELAHAEPLFEHHYAIGNEAYKQKQNGALAAGAGIVAVGGGGYYLYRRKRNNKKKAELF